MGLFNFLKKKESVFDSSDLKSQKPKINLRFRKEYIWGFTQGNPMKQAGDKINFYKLIKPLTGSNGTITIGSSFHPYQIIDKNGVDLWDTIFSVIESNNFCDFEELITNKDFFHMVPPGSQAFPFNVWNDERLLTDNNPAFGKFVPFIIPYLTNDTGSSPEWVKSLNEEIDKNGNAHDFITKINEESRFLMPEPSFIIGFGQFEDNKPENLIDNFVDFMEKNLKGK